MVAFHAVLAPFWRCRRHGGLRAPRGHRPRGGLLPPRRRAIVRAVDACTCILVGGHPATSAMAVTRVPTRRTPDAGQGKRAALPAATTDADRLAAYARRGPECAFANARVLARVVGAFYDEMLKPADVRASQLALLWAILACEPVDQKSLERVTQTDQTTLSRTVERLRAEGLVTVSTATDRRVRIIRLSPHGRRVFLRAMPFWEEAQRAAAQWLPLGDVRRLARAAHRFARLRESSSG
jgi:DNA-binding MarR family transcriptional regulator